MPRELSHSPGQMPGSSGLAGICRLDGLDGWISLLLSSWFPCSLAEFHRGQTPTMHYIFQSNLQTLVSKFNRSTMRRTQRKRPTFGRGRLCAQFWFSLSLSLYCVQRTVDSGNIVSRPPNNAIAHNWGKNGTLSCARNARSRAPLSGWLKPEPLTLPHYRSYRWLWSPFAAASPAARPGDTDVCPNKIGIHYLHV